MDKIFQAIDFAQKAHLGQYRKGRKVPYILHPIAVMDILMQNTDKEDVIIAGLLHDTLEDTSVTPEQIEKRFGPRVLELVQSASEPDKSLPRIERKKHTIEYIIKLDDQDALMVSCADKLHNVTSFIEDYKKSGPALWNNFNEPDKNKHLWYYQSLASAYLKHDAGNPLFQKYQQSVSNFIKIVKENEGTDITKLSQIKDNRSK